MKAEQLRKSILQLAIQGKLVKQDPNDEPASVLLERIRAEKQCLIKEGKIKKDKGDSIIFKGDDNCHYEKIGSEVKNIEDEIPFEIPNSWCWVHIEKITIPVGNKDNQILTSQILKEGDIPVVSQSKNLIDGYSNVIERRISDLPLIMFGDHTKAVKLINFPFVIGADGTKFFKPLLVNAKYLYFLIDYVAKILPSRGYARHYTLLKKQYLPLPPLTEQERIVKEIERFEPLLADYDKLEQQATQLDSEIYDKLKKSILQYAIQGKLVKQDETDEPASVLLERIRAEKKAQLGKKYVESYIYKGDDNCYYEHIGGKDVNITEEIPFDLPNGWEWARLKSIINSLTDGTHSTPKYTTSGVPFISVKDVSSGKLSFSNTKFISIEEHTELKKRCNPQRGDILLTKVGTTGIPVLIDSDIEFSLFVSVALIKFNAVNILPEYFIYLLKSPLVQEQAAENTRGVGNKNWVLSDIEKTLLVLPPLAEQKRIVDKINEIFAKL